LTEIALVAVFSGRLRQVGNLTKAKHFLNNYVGFLIYFAAT
jgi:hypothetical protein